MTKTCCVGGKPYSSTNIISEYEKRNPKPKKLVKIMKGNCSICNRNKSQFFTEKVTRGENFVKNAKCTHGHPSAVSEKFWCDLNEKCTVSKLHDMCHNPKSNCQKQITFSPNQFQLEGAVFKNTMKKVFKGSQTAPKNILKPAGNTLAPVIGMVVGAKTRNPKVAQATTNILKTISGGRILSLTDMPGGGLRLKVT